MFESIHLIILVLPSSLPFKHTTYVPLLTHIVTDQYTHTHTHTVTGQYRPEATCVY